MRGAGRVRRVVGERALRVAERATGNRYHRDDPAVIRVGLYRPLEGPRWGWGKPRHEPLRGMLAARHQELVDYLEVIKRYADGLGAIDKGHREDFEPCWTNDLFIGLDGASLYGFLRDRRPRRYVEIGSGYSTRFAARAKRDGDLPTKITSIDPEPRVGIDAICDEIVRQPLEAVDLALFSALEEGDIVLLDGSHRVLPGNDVAVFFLEVLPTIPPGVLVGVHDMFIPDDYPDRFVGEAWTEQYMLMASLLGDAALHPVLPVHYVATTDPMMARLRGLWDEIGLEGTNAWGSLFWFERR
jgi:hypothetical protein